MPDSLLTSMKRRQSLLLYSSTKPFVFAAGIVLRFMAYLHSILRYSLRKVPRQTEFCLTESLKRFIKEQFQNCIRGAEPSSSVLVMERISAT